MIKLTIKILPSPRLFLASGIFNTPAKRFRNCTVCCAIKKERAVSRSRSSGLLCHDSRMIPRPKTLNLYLNIRAIRLGGRKQGSGEKSKSGGNKIARERGLHGIELHDLVVIELARESNTIFRRGELLLQQQHILRRPHLRVILDDRKQTSQR